MSAAVSGKTRRAPGPRVPALMQHEQPLAINGTEIGFSPSASPEDACSILVVDDNVDAAHTFNELLQSYGHTVDMAFEGPSALKKLEWCMPDVAILDIGLPGMDGYELAARIRHLPGARQMRLVALTGYGKDSDPARSLAAGFDYHVTKPLTSHAMHTILSILPAEKPRQ